MSRNGTDAISYPMFALEARMMAFITPSLCSVRNMCWEGREGREGRGGREGRTNITLCIHNCECASKTQL